ncbi:MAG: TIGR04283 family arsenosugar biosynthesis glycosyltransferase [Bryobacteraceae bacterium]|nr:TIGR04283 family arsenosugar biosynthesis glycosyltransferase [Bryobacteraceae bacterium]
MISVIIPALNERFGIAATLQAIFALDPDLEVLVVDGGSQDGTPDAAAHTGAHVLQSAPGRGVQLAKGASEARGDVLWFVHADTLPHPRALNDIEAALNDPGVAGGNFRLRFDGATLAARFLNRLQGLRAWLGWHYGDNTIFVRSDVYRRIGGFRPYPLFEDADLVKRIRCAGQFVSLAGPVTTSSRRFEDGRFLSTGLLWIVLQTLYWCGLSPHALAHLYAPVRRKARAEQTGPHLETEPRP